MWQGHVAGSWLVWCPPGHKVLSCRAPFKLVRPQCGVLSGVIHPQVLDFVFHCWTSWSSCWPIPLLPSEGYNPLAYQPLLPVLHHQQTPWLCALSHHVCHWRRELKIIILGINSRGRPLGTFLQVDSVLIKPLGAGQFSQLSDPSASTYLVHISFLCQWGCYERPWKVKMNTHSSFHHRWLLGWSSPLFPFPMLIMSIISLSAIHLECFPGEFVPGPEVRLSRRPLDPSSDPSERWGWYLFFSSPLETVQSQPPFRDYWEWPLKGHQPTPLALMGRSHQVLGICLYLL